MRTLTVTPAYGRDYKSAKDAKADWNAGKDFRVQDFKLSGYINNADAKAIDVDAIHIRYNKLQKVTVIPITR